MVQKSLEELRREKIGRSRKSLMLRLMKLVIGDLSGLAREAPWTVGKTASLRTKF